MNLTKQDFASAIKVLKDVGIVDSTNQYLREYSGKLSSIGPDTIYMGLLPAIGLYESKPTDDAGKFKANVCKAILQLMPPISGKKYTLLYQYVKDNNDNRTQFYIDKAIVSLKLGIRLFKEIKNA